MTYSGKLDLEAEKSVRIIIHNESDMLKGEINRMFNTDDLGEISLLYISAKKRMDKIFEYHVDRVREYQNIIGGVL